MKNMKNKVPTDFTPLYRVNVKRTRLQHLGVRQMSKAALFHKNNHDYLEGWV